MELERKVFRAYEVKASQPDGVIEAIVSVFNNEDEGKDIVRPGFFQKSLERKLPKGVWMHDWAQPVAKTLVAEEWQAGDSRLPLKLRDLGGLYIKGQFNLETQRGKEAFSDIAFGIIDEFSIGYVATKVMWNEENYTRELIEGDLYEWSPVLAGMNPETMLLSAKSLGDGSLAGLALKDHLDAVLAAVRGVQDRVVGLVELRQKERKAGRMISGENMERLTAIHEAMTGAHGSMAECITAMKELMDKANPPQEEEGDGSKSLETLYLDYLHRKHVQQRQMQTQQLTGATN